MADVMITMRAVSLVAAQGSAPSSPGVPQTAKLTERSTRSSGGRRPERRLVRVNLSWLPNFQLGSRAMAQPVCAMRRIRPRQAHALQAVPQAPLVPSVLRILVCRGERRHRGAALHHLLASTDVFELLLVVLARTQRSGTCSRELHGLGGRLARARLPVLP